jgi:hypothetical protein
MTNAEFKMQNAELGARGSGLGAEGHFSTASSRTPNPEPRIPSSRPRRAVTIVEVLFAILVTAVGLLGAIAIFPVASSQAKKARQNDTVAHTGHSAVHMFDSYDMRDPEKWYEWVNSAGGAQFSATFTLPSSIGTNAFCLDNRFVVSNTVSGLSGASSSPWINAQHFPYVPLTTASFLSPIARMKRVAFFPGKLAAGTATSPQDQFDRFNDTTTRRNALLADSMFMLDDDLLSLRPGFDDVSKLGFANDRSIPAIQQFDGGFAVPQKRQSLGRITWMATIVPRIDLNTGLASDRYNLSIVVFSDRTTDLRLTTANENLLERVVNCTVTGDGSSGGELLISWTSASSNADVAAERLKLRANDWIMLSHRNTTPPIDRFQWYRVTHVEPDIDYGNEVTGAFSRYVSVVGPDWDATLTGTQATLIDGIVAVYEKTIRLNIH